MAAQQLRDSHLRALQPVVSQQIVFFWLPDDAGIHPYVCGRECTRRRMGGICEVLLSTALCRPRCALIQGVGQTQPPAIHNTALYGRSEMYRYHRTVGILHNQSRLVKDNPITCFPVLIMRDLCAYQNAFGCLRTCHPKRNSSNEMSPCCCHVLTVCVIGVASLELL